MNDERPVYTAAISREGNMWVAVVDGLPGGATDTPNFADLEVFVPDLIASLTDSDPADFAVEWRYEHGGRDLTEALANYLEWEKWSRFATAKRDEARRIAIDDMRAAGLSLRAIADATNLSHQRIAQIAEAERPRVEVSHPQITVAAQFVQHALNEWEAGRTGSVERGQASPRGGSAAQLVAAESYRPAKASARSPITASALAAVLDQALTTSPDERPDFLAAVSHVLDAAAEEPGFA
ncbi:hypothetical protein [Saccharopolyspora griseoalba]|uniref:Uncharacterized protein n=1 Tax=Saccharopolyspora griseoalba TaxID=1431848 RepID=A0ABW2LIR8_9PSEU